MSLLPKPTPPPYDPLEWDRSPWPDKVRQVCQAWAMQGYGAPLPVYGLYLVKIVGYVLIWAWFCGWSAGVQDWTDLGAWILTPAAFQKAILWSMLYEGLGFGCGSGPLTGRYFPPVGGLLYWLRPGTVRRPLFPSLPLLGGHRRSILDVVLYAAHNLLLLRLLLAPELTVELLLPTVVLLPLLGLRDKTLFLAARGEHYYATTVCFLFGADWIAGAMAVQVAIWMWAATSKLTHHFPSVVGVMTSNSPITRAAWMRRAMYRSFPDDLRPSRLAVVLAHAGTVVEFGFPLVLVFGGPELVVVGLGVMVVFHTYITSNFPMAVPIEWNLVVVYSGFFLWGQHPEVVLWSLRDPVLIAFLVAMLVVVPLVGNLVPSRVSFLMSMRYYAGNWPYSIWLFRGGALEKLKRIPMSAPLVKDQVRLFYDEATAVGMIGKVIGFRAMHLHGRALHTLLPRAVEGEVRDYELLDGELIAGMVLGWNFGCGHLHDEGLLAAVQAGCGFEEGELRCIFVESQPLHRPRQHWRIHDAALGLLEEGHIEVAELRRRAPWPEADPT